MLVIGELFLWTKLASKRWISYQTREDGLGEAWEGWLASIRFYYQVSIAKGSHGEYRALRSLLYLYKACDKDYKEFWSEGPWKTREICFKNNMGLLDIIYSPSNKDEDIYLSLFQLQ